MKRIALLIVVALTFTVAGCGSDDKPTDKASPGDSKGAAAAAAFCADFRGNGGRETTVRPVPHFAPKEQMLSVVDAVVNAMGSIVPPAAIASQWETTKAAFVKLQGQVSQLKPGATFGPKQQKDVEAEMQSLFTSSSKDVINYVLKNCL